MTDEASPAVERFLIRRLVMTQAGWPRIWILNCSEAAAEAGEILGGLGKWSASVGLTYLSLDRLGSAHPLTEWAVRFAKLAGCQSEPLGHDEAVEPYLQFAAAARAAIQRQKLPILISMSDGEAIRQRPDGQAILSALRAVLDEAQQAICAVFLLPDYLATCRFCSHPDMPFFEAGMVVNLGAEIAAASAA